MQSLKRLLARLLQPAWKLAVRFVSVEDPWERFTTTPGLHLYGSGVRHDFGHFLDGESAVSVRSLDEILDWLLGCSYESDERLFHEADFWQHPTTFEHLRAGDCEDFALWAWRKLVELGYDAELITGRCGPNPMESRHAWVVFRTDGQEYLLEAVARERERMVRPLAEVRREYIPEFGVGPTCQRFAFAGYLLSAKHHLGLPVVLPTRRPPSGPRDHVVPLTRNGGDPYRFEKEIVGGRITPTAMPTAQTASRHPLATTPPIGRATACT